MTGGDCPHSKWDSEKARDPDASLSSGFDSHPLRPKLALRRVSRRVIFVFGIRSGIDAQD